MLSDDFSFYHRVRLDLPYFEILKYQVSYFIHKNYRGSTIFQNNSCLSCINKHFGVLYVSKIKYDVHTKFTYFQKYLALSLKKNGGHSKFYNIEHFYKI